MRDVYFPATPFQLALLSAFAELGRCLVASPQGIHHHGPPALPAYTPAPHISPHGYSPAPYPAYGYSPTPYHHTALHHPYTPAPPAHYPPVHKKPVSAAAEASYEPPKCALNTTKSWYSRNKLVVESD